MTTQRDQIAAMLLEAMYATANDPVPDYGEPTHTLDGTWSAWTEVLADALIARGVRVGVDDLIAAVEAVIAQADHFTSGRLWEYEMNNLKRALAALDAETDR